MGHRARRGEDLFGCVLFECLLESQVEMRGRLGQLGYESGALESSGQDL